MTLPNFGCSLEIMRASPSCTAVIVQGAGTMALSKAP